MTISRAYLTAGNGGLDHVVVLLDSSVDDIPDVLVTSIGTEGEVTMIDNGDIERIFVGEGYDLTEDEFNSESNMTGSAILIQYVSPTPQEYRYLHISSEMMSFTHKSKIIRALSAIGNSHTSTTFLIDEEGDYIVGSDDKAHLVKKRDVMGETFGSIADQYHQDQLKMYPLNIVTKAERCSWTRQAKSSIQ